MVETALVGWDLDALDLLCIESVGNLVYPASYGLGKDMRALLCSATEGEDKPLTYLTFFNTATQPISRFSPRSIWRTRSDSTGTRSTRT